MITLKVTTIGTAECLILSEEAKQRLNVNDGDTLILTEAPDGALRITPHDPEFARQMTLAESIMQDDWQILRALAQ
jgi:putative addiction module antidote